MSVKNNYFFYHYCYYFIEKKPCIGNCQILTIIHKGEQTLPKEKGKIENTKNKQQHKG